MSISIKPSLEHRHPTSIPEISEGDILICDADVIISAETLQRMYVVGSNVILEKVVESSTNVERLAFGIIRTRIKDLYFIGGYDSRFKGWGFEDHDIIWRLTINGATFQKLGIAIHLSHGDDERIQFYHSLDLKSMREVNKRFYEKKQLLGDVVGTMDQDNL